MSSGTSGYNTNWASQLQHMARGSSREHLRTKVTPGLHLTYSKNGENLGSDSK